MQARAITLAVLVTCVLLFGLPACKGPERVIDYNWDIRPILSNNCFQCHGPDDKARKRGLRLDLRENATGPLPESPGKVAIQPGDPDASELIRRVASSDPDLVMPPPSAHRTLSAADVEVLTRWIADGANYKSHWSFAPLERPDPPKTRFDSLATNDIDRFVYRQLDSRGLAPSDRADRSTLINRLALALTGLPPTLQEVEAFVSDPRADAYEALVERLLAQPAYGERMASMWLDVARYAESDGYLDDMMDRTVHPWRDWVIDAFNRNMPFDEFSRWQLAGDLLPNATDEQRLATAFLRLGKRSTENGVIDEEKRVDYVLERTELVGEVWLGLTVGCARCHDHKFDPIAQKDYYALSAFFNSADERGFYSPGWISTSGPTLPVFDPATKARLATAVDVRKRLEVTLDAAITAAQTGVEPPKTAAELASTLEAGVAAATVAYYPFEAVERRDTKALYVRRRNGTGDLSQPILPRGLIEENLLFSPSGLSGKETAVLESVDLVDGIRGQAVALTDTNRGYLPDGLGRFERTDAFSFSFWLKLDRVHESGGVVNHRDQEFAGGYGYSLDLIDNRLQFELVHTYPNDMLSVRARDPLPVGEWAHVAMTYDGRSRAEDVAIYVNGIPVVVDVIRDTLTRTILPQLFAGVTEDFYGFTFGKRFRRSSIPGSLIDELRIFDRQLAALEVRFDHRGSAAVEAATDEEIAALVASRDQRVMDTRKQLRDAWDVENDLLSQAAVVMVMGDTPSPRETHVLERGLYSRPLETVQAHGLPQVLEWNERWPRNRSGLVEWLFDRRNPLTARVLANRMWQLHFGRGLVDTSGDFGAQGSVPSHPELLDWLAMELVDSGWDLKHIHRLIVSSSTYRQTSNADAERLAQDPDNRWLSRGVRQRLPAEMIRDGALMAGGLMVPAIGGPSVYPYQPDGTWDQSSAQKSYVYPAADMVPADEHHRRSLYTVVKRNAQPPSLSVFDFADRNNSTVQRGVSSSPLQALVLLNDPQYVESYRAMAARTLAATEDTRDRLAMLYRLALRRSPSSEELDILAEYYAAELSRYEAAPADARDLISTGVAPIAATADVATLAALTSVASAVMNTPDAYWLR